MLIRLLVVALLLVAAPHQESIATDPIASVELAKRVKYVFKVKTESGGIVGNILIEGKDVFDCIAKLNKRYPGCTVLEARKK